MLGVTAAGLVGVAGAHDALTLEPTVVTGLGVDDVPAAGATGVSAEDLDLYQVETLQGLSGLAPNLHFSSSDSRGYGDVVTMRGQGNTLFFGPAAVGLYVDDVPYADAFSYPSELTGEAGVQIHRGPQGPGFGRNAAAGLIEITTPGPTEELQMQLSTDYGSYDSYGFNFGSSGPLGGDFSHTLEVYYNERDGFVNNVFLGQHTDTREAMGVLANLYWNPSGDVEWRLRIAAEEMNDGSQRLSSLFSPDPFTVASNIPGETNIERYQVSLHGRRDFDWGRMKTITSYQDWSLDPSTVDLDFSPMPDASSRILQDQTYLTQELRFESAEGAGPLAWRAGLFASRKETDGDATRGYKTMGFDVTEQTLFDIDETSVAGYGRVSYRINETIGVEAGGRLDYVESSLNRTQSTTFGPGMPLDLDTDGIYFSPTGGINYTVAQGVNLFARTGLGIKPRGYTAFSNDELETSYGDERSWTNEVGVSVDCPEHALSFGLRGFWSDISDYQLNKSVPGTSDFIILNADEVTSRGVEAEMRWRPMERLEVQAAVGFQDTEFDSYAYTDPTTMITTDYSGNHVPYVPEFTAGAGFRYDFGNGFFLGSSVRATGKTFYDDSNDTNPALFTKVSQDAFVVWDAQAGYQGDGWDVTVYGKNLLDEEYYNFIDSQIYAGAPGDPQLFGVRVTVEF